MTRVGQKVKMTSLDELLCVPAIEGTKDIEIDLISEFKGHPFKVTDDSRMDELVESIKANGILSPVIVRPMDDGKYEMISGHRRMHAAGRAGLTKIPAIVKSLTDDEATIIMVDANVQREDLLASREIENIFENSDFILMLNQAGGDRQILAKQLNISPHQLSFVTNSNAGEGLLFYGNTIIPFKDRFPKDTKLYKIMTTNPREMEQVP